MSTIPIGANCALNPLVENRGTSTFAHLYLTLTDDAGDNQVHHLAERPRLQVWTASHKRLALRTL